MKIYFEGEETSNQLNEYKHGVKLTKKEMDELDEGFIRKAGIEKWFVQVEPRAG